jgi:iron complex outermembrane receptor protein
VIGRVNGGACFPAKGIPCTSTVLNQGIGSTYSVTPPRTYGVEVDYKFF